MAEQLALDHGFGQRTGIDGDKGAVATAGQVVQGPRHDFLARTRFTEDQHVGLGTGQCADLLAQALHGR